MVTLFIKKARRSTRRRKMTAVKPSRAIELGYKAELLAMVKAYRDAVDAQLMPLLRRSGIWSTQDASINDRIKAAFDSIRARFTKMTDKRALLLAKKVVKKSEEEVEKRLKSSIKESIGVDISGVLTRSKPLGVVIGNAVETNVSLIKSIPINYLGRVEQAVYAAVSGGIRWESLVDEIQGLGEVTESRARLIARDQVAKMNSSINRVRQLDMGITQYRWSTSGDERVRPTHEAHDGKIFDWSDPPEDTGHPGEDYQCRCVAIAIIDFGEDNDV